MSVFNWSFEPSSEIPGNLTRPIPSVSTHKSSSEVHSSVRATIPRSPMMDEACQSCRYFGCESTLDTLDTQGPPQDIKCRGLWMAGREPHKGQEGKRTNTLGGLMVGELVARLLWGCWRHLARDPLGDTAVLSRSRSLCATPSGRGKVFGAHPGSTCCRLVSGFLFSQGLSFHLVTLCSFVRPQTPQSSPPGFDRHGQSSLIYASLTLARL